MAQLGLIMTQGHKMRKNMKEETINAGTMKQTLGGKFKIAVIDAKTDKVVWEQPDWQKNLILNNGMNQVANSYYVNLMDYGIVGTGTRANSAYSNLGTISQTGNTLTLIPDSSFISLTSSLNGYDRMLQVGDSIVFETGSGGITNVLVTDSITNLTCNANKNASIPSTPFTIWKTSQIGLQSEVKRSNTCVAGYGNCGSTFSENVLTSMRTWDFTIETSPTSYTEVGIGWANNNPGNTFSRLLLPSPVVVDIDQKIRLSYQLQITVQPSSSFARPDAFIEGWTLNSSSGSTTAGSESIQICVTGTPDTYGNFYSSTLTYVCYSGAQGMPSIHYNYGGGGGGGSLEPASNDNDCAFWIAPNSQSLSTFNSAVDRSPNSTIAGVNDGGTYTYHNNYIQNSFTLSKTAMVGLYGANSNNLRSMGFGHYDHGNSIHPAQSDFQAFAFVFNQPQTKYNTQTLTLSYTWTWDRSFIA